MTETRTARISLDLPLDVIDHAAFRGGMAVKEPAELSAMLNDPARLPRLQQAVAAGIVEVFRLWEESQNVGDLDIEGDDAIF